MLKKILAMAFVLAATTFIYANTAKALQVITDGLVSYWTFNKADVKGDVAKDIWGHNDGTIKGCKQTEGKVGEALEFDGKSNFVEVPYDKSLDFSASYTIEAWIFQNIEKGSGCRIVDKCTAGTTDGYCFDTYPGRKLRLCAASDCISADTNFNINEWHHVVVTFNKRDVKFYLDGKPDGGRAAPGDMSTNALPLRIGYCAGDALCSTEYFSGVIDEVRVYDRALNQNEVKQNMSAEGLAVERLDKLAVTWGDIKSSS